MRIATGGICHETSTFAHDRTTIDNFARDRGVFRGQELIERFAGSNTCTGGFIDGAAKHAFELVPLFGAFGFPSGLIRNTDYQVMLGEFLQRLRQEEATGGRIDGVLLDLHGAMVVEGIDDGDGHFIATVRDAIGPDRPIVVTQDLHGNHTALRVEKADAIIGFDTYPHIDMAERGREAADLIVDILCGEVKPVMALFRLPLFWNTARQVTAHPPMDEVMRRAHELESRPGIVSVTVATGFPWADVPEMGASVIVVANGDQALADAAAAELGGWIWERREQWYSPPMSVREALAAGEAAGKYPIILADHADNTGGGAPGDSTEVLRTFLELDLQDAVILYMVDPEVAELAHQAGVGSTIRVAVGGKSDPAQGDPVEMNAEVVVLSEGDFRYEGPMYSGLAGTMRRSAWLRQGGVSVVVVTAREQPFCPAFARTLGIDCARLRYIAVKSAAHFRSGFEPIAGSIYNVDAQAIHTHDFARLDYKKRPRPMFPLEIPPRG